MRIICDTQDTAEWFMARCGNVTASAVKRARKKNVKGPLKGVTSADRENYKIELATEILTGKNVEHWVSPAMDQGKEREPMARAEYEFLMGVDVERTGFVLHPEIDRFGASPDGLIGDDGCLEIKCPLPWTHLRYIQEGVVPEEYVDQVQAQIVCCEREWADFISFCPEMPTDLRMFRVRVPRDEKRIAEIEADVQEFLREVAQYLQALPSNLPAKGNKSKFVQQLEDSILAAEITDDDIRLVDPEYAR